MMVKLVWD